MSADTKPTSSLLDTLLSKTHRLLNTILPPPRRAAILDVALAHPVLATLVICQVLCSALPLGLFLAGVALTAAVAATVFACLGLLLLVPALTVTTSLGLCLWGWGWVLFVGVRWVGARVQAGGGGVNGYGNGNGK